jgi:hypothetical protein
LNAAAEGARAAREADAEKARFEKAFRAWDRHMTDMTLRIKLSGDWVVQDTGAEPT